jgi:hypothetical protein
MLGDRAKTSEKLWLAAGFRHLRVQACIVGAITGILLYTISLISERVDAKKLAPSTPRSSIAINARNEGVVHSGPGEPATGRLFRAGVGDR